MTVVRPFRFGDEPALWDVFCSAIRGTAAADYSPEQIAAWAPMEIDIRKWAERMQGISPFIAEQRGAIVGYADVQPSGYIDHFFVATPAGRQGVGSVLMRTLIGVAQAQGIESLYSDVSVTARPFFERWGFTVEYPRTLSLPGATLDNFRMRKSLEHQPTQ